MSIERYGTRSVNRIDFGALKWAASELTSEVYEKTEIGFSQVEEYFKAGWITMLCVDLSVLYAGKRFSGHAIILTGLDDNRATYHDPARGPHKEMDRDRLVRAWSAKGTDRAVLLVKGRE